MSKTEVVKSSALRAYERGSAPSPALAVRQARQLCACGENLPGLPGAWGSLRGVKGALRRVLARSRLAPGCGLRARP